jgi:hypothetical protein
MDEHYASLSWVGQCSPKWAIRPSTIEGLAPGGAQGPRCHQGRAAKHRRPELLDRDLRERSRAKSGARCRGWSGWVALAARDPRPCGARLGRLLDRGPAAANRLVPDCVAQAAVGIAQEEGHFGPVRSTFALRAIRIRSRAAISNLSSHAAQAAGLAHDLEGHVVQGCVQPGDRLAGGGPGGESISRRITHQRSSSRATIPRSTDPGRPRAR